MRSIPGIGYLLLALVVVFAAFGSGFATVAFSTAHVMTKAVGDDLRRYPIFLMVAGTR